MAHTKDIGVALMSGLELIDEFETIDWDNDATPTGRAVIFGFDASNGYDNITLDTEVGVFRITITRIG